MNDIDVLMEFLKMPLKNSDEVFNKFSEIPGAILRGTGLELKRFLFIKGKRENRVLLVAHADTFWDEYYDRHYNEKPQELIQKDGIIKNKNGGLGADDRAGCAIIWLLKDIGHSILITDGEEDGRIGSHWLIDKNHDISKEINSNHQFVIQLDRESGKDFKCYDVGTDEFRTYVKYVTGYSEPNRRSYTDIVTLCRDICGVNLSVGYHDEHSEYEFLVLSEWVNTLNMCREWLSENELPRYGRNENNT